MALPKAAKVTTAATIGAKRGAQLAAEVPHEMLQRFYDLPPDPQAPPLQFGPALEALRTALGPLADQAAIANAFHALDTAYGDDSANRTNETWHAAWMTAIGYVKGGA